MFPFTLPFLQDLKTFQLHPKVTYLVGENGSGKSTLLEALAVAAGFNAEGGTKNFNFSTKATHSSLDEYLTLVRGGRRERDGFFLRAESFYNVATEIERLDRIVPGLLGSYGGVSPHVRSHGEGFLALVNNRFSRDSLLLLDEPESALSPARQLTLLQVIHRLVTQEGCQVVMATHSPILMSYPESLMLSIEDGLNPIDWRDTDHFRLTRDFLNNPEVFLKRLFRAVD